MMSLSDAPTWLSFVIGVIAGSSSTIVTLTGLRRAPHLRAAWVSDDGDGRYPPFEGITIDATIRRRPVEIQQIGVLAFPSGKAGTEPSRFLQPANKVTDRIFSDGETISAIWELDSLLEAFSSEGVATAQVECVAFVRASGVDYLTPILPENWSTRKWKRVKKLRESLRVRWTLKRFVLREK
jgi:hypothetical protein